MISDIKILFHQGKQYIPDVTTVEVPGIFRGRPVISTEPADVARLVEICPTGAISPDPVSIDMGKCVFCGECQFAFPGKIKFTKDYRISSGTREGLIIPEGRDEPVTVNPVLVRKEIRKYFGKSLKLRQVSAGGDNSCEWELNAAGNVNFDMGRFGIEFVASPRHADGIVITGPITKNMARPLQICYDAVPHPKVIILAGTDAISGGIFAGSNALDRSFLDKYPVDLFVPGNPVHPLTFINGVLDLIRNRK
jgi:Ni,Fe-hydrogenase III small subunit/NAD-dependent dihydropyrimidine dehydrogenase PreA subunit